MTIAHLKQGHAVCQNGHELEAKQMQDGHDMHAYMSWAYGLIKVNLP